MGITLLRFLSVENIDSIAYHFILIPTSDIFHVLFNFFSVFLNVRLEKKIYNNYKGDNHKLYV